MHQFEKYYFNFPPFTLALPAYRKGNPRAGSPLGFRVCDSFESGIKKFKLMHYQNMFEPKDSVDFNSLSLYDIYNSDKIVL